MSGRLRGGQTGGSGKKSEQTLNRLIAEIDGNLPCGETGGDSSGCWERPTTTEASTSPLLPGRLGEKASGPVDCILQAPSASPSVSRHIG